MDHLRVQLADRRINHRFTTIAIDHRQLAASGKEYPLFALITQVCPQNEEMGCSRTEALLFTNPTGTAENHGISNIFAEFLDSGLAMMKTGEQ